jgi:SAM-dependent methyltransferase
MSDPAYDSYLQSHPGLNTGATEADFHQLAADYGKVYDLFLPADRTSIMLDVGCGQGFFVYYLRSRGFANSSGIDVSPPQAEFGRRFGLDIRTGDALDLLRAPGQYDWISLLDVLEHVLPDRVVPLLQAIYASLKPNGLCVVQVPNMENPFNVAVRYSDFTHRGGFTSGSLVQVLRLAGFQAFDVYPVGELRQRWVKRVIRRLVSEFLLRLYEIPNKPMGAHASIQYSRRIVAVARKT